MGKSSRIKPKSGTVRSRGKTLGTYRISSSGKLTVRPGSRFR